MRRKRTTIHLRSLCDDDGRLKVITCFDCEKFLEIYELVADELPVKRDRGKRSKVGKHDRLLMTQGNTSYAKKGEILCLDSSTAVP